MIKWIPLYKGKAPPIGMRVHLKVVLDGLSFIKTGTRLADVMGGVEFKNIPWFQTDDGIVCGRESVTHWAVLSKIKELFKLDSPATSSPNSALMVTDTENKE